MKRVFILMAMTVTLLALAVPSASAAGFEIPIDTVVRADPGSLTVLADVETPPEFVGLECVGLAVATNQDSVHPGNDLMIRTGQTTATLVDVEGSPGKITEALGAVTLGNSVTVTLSMGSDGVFSGGFAIVIDVNCSQPPVPNIGIVKTADPTTYVNNTGEFTIAVTNTGPVDLNSVFVEDDYALNIDPTSKCATTIGDLAIGETFTYECTIAGLDGVSTYDNTATATGTGPRGIIVTATDNAIVVPEVLATTITQAPSTTQAPATTSAPSETLPVTGIDGAQAEGFGIAGLVLVLVGIVLLGGAALIGQRKSIG